MKKWIYIFILLLLSGFTAISQEDEAANNGSKIAERMKEYIQKNLGMTKNESEKFSPVFIRYFREFVQTHQQNKGDRLIFQQKIIELRLRYRGEFKQIMDEQKANKVFHFEDRFRQEVIRIIKENKRDRPPPRRTKALLLND